MNNLIVFFDKVKLRLFSEWHFQRKRVLKLFRKFYSEQHQLTSTTTSDRYPELFEQCQKAVQYLAKENLSMLSFGCSTGEECFTLRRYFPKGNIIGADINRLNIAKAKNNNTDEHIRFILSTKNNIEREGLYDLIFCLSVLCRWEDTEFVENCEKIYPFDKFQGTVKMLSNVLSPGGLLVIYNSNFCFEDTTTFIQDGFEIVATPSIKDSGFVYKFDKNNNRTRIAHKSCIYRKIGGPQTHNGTDFDSERGV